MFDDYVTDDNVADSTMMDVDGVTPSELSAEEKKELNSIAQKIQKKTGKYLTKGYEIGVGNAVKQGTVVIWVEVVCPTGQVMQMDVVPSVNDVSSGDVNENKSDELSCSGVSKEFVAQMISEMLDLDAQRHDTKQSMPAS